MSAKQPYSYVVLRYVHDVLTGEFVNVGLLMVAPRSGEFLAKTRKTFGRIKQVFPDLDSQAFRAAMSSVDRGIRGVRKQVGTAGLFSDQKDAASYAHLILSSDDSALQWSSLASGLSTDTAATFDRLYERFVSRYDTSSQAKKSDDDVWRPVKEMLSERHIDLTFEPKVVCGKTDSIEFSRAWKNGSWHVYEPLSFDLADADGIKDKARRWRGHLAAVEEGAAHDIQLHFLIGRPTNLALLDAYHNALEILKGAPFDPVVFEEANVEEFVNAIEDELREHQAKATQ